jgi:hypothetical protein
MHQAEHRIGRKKASSSVIRTASVPLGTQGNQPNLAAKCILKQTGVAAVRIWCVVSAKDAASAPAA